VDGSGRIPGPLRAQTDKEGRRASGAGCSRGRRGMEQGSDGGDESSVCEMERGSGMGEMAD
jgi:hypothetical protein